MKRLAFDAAFLLLLLLIGLATAEVAIRIVNPTPRRVIVRADHIGGFHHRDGVLLDQVVLWHDGPPNGRRARTLEDRACDPEGAFVVALVGDSIFNGISVPADEVASVRLKRRLTAAHPDVRVCVVNLAVPAYSLYQGFARLRPRIDALAPDVVLVEFWGGPPRVPVEQAGAAYLLEGRPDDPWLGNPWHLPPALHTALLRTSRLYEFVVVGWPAACDRCRLELAPHVALLDDALERVRDVGGDLITVMPASLAEPFDDQHASTFDENADYEAWVADHDVQNVRLWEAMAHLDVADVRLDPVHLNAAGHDALADVFVDVITPRLEAWKAAREAE